MKVSGCHGFENADQESEPKRMVHVKEVQCSEKPQKTRIQISGKLYCTFPLRDECPQDGGYSQKDEQHALAVAKKFSIPTKTIILDAIYDALLKVLPVDEASATSQVAKGNLKARLRMLTLYFHANRLQYLVVGSGNRSELAVGYFTKHGDGSVDILPLGNLVKSQVKELARFLGIPQEIIDKPPSAGLWLGQTDEGELGLSYDQLDCYLTTSKAPDSIKQKIELMITKSNHKRNPPPVPDF